MMGGIIDVSFLVVRSVLCWTNCGVVHAEPGEDKVTYAKDVVDWILARSG